MFTYSSPFVQYGETPLHIAAKNGSTEAVKLLLKYNAFKEAKAKVRDNCIFFKSLSLLTSLWWYCSLLKLEF